MSHSAPHRRPRRGRALLIGLAALLVAACATPTPVREVGLSRETPEATYEYFKTMARNNQWAAEWSVFSPNFKRMLNAEAGKVVDLGDYTMARQAPMIASNGTSEMQMLLNSNLQGTAQHVGPDRAKVTISAGGRTISPTMIRLTKWEIKIRGTDEPASGVVSRPGDAIQVNEDGSITVRVQADPGVAAALRTIPREQIEGFAIKSEWYVDDFGGLGGAMGAGMGNRPAPTQPQRDPGTDGRTPTEGYGSPG